MDKNWLEIIAPILIQLRCKDISHIYSKTIHVNHKYVNRKQDSCMFTVVFIQLVQQALISWLSS